MPSRPPLTRIMPQTEGDKISDADLTLVSGLPRKEVSGRGSPAGSGLPYCPLGSGCDVVQSSRYPQVFGVPVAGLGLGFYGIVLALGILPLERMTRWRLALPTTAAGVAASLGFTVVQYVRIRATCSLCLASAVLALGYLSSGS